jgi:hypothetical protein
VTFRGRMVGAVTAVTVVTLGGAFMAIYFAVNRSQERQLDAALLTEALGACWSKAMQNRSTSWGSM